MAVIVKLYPASLFDEPSSLFAFWSLPSKGVFRRSSSCTSWWPSQKSLVAFLTESLSTSWNCPGGGGAQLATGGLLGMLDGVVSVGVVVVAAAGGDVDGAAVEDVEGGADVDVDVEDAAAVEEGVLVAAAEVDVEAAAVVDEGELLAD